MKSKIWAFRIMSHSDSGNYFQMADMKFYDNASALIDTSSARAWASLFYTTSDAGNLGPAALFDGDMTTWLAMTESNNGGNLLIVTFPTEVEIGSFEITNRAERVLRGIIEVYTTHTNGEIIYQYPETHGDSDFNTYEDMVYAGSFQISLEATQATASFSFSSPSITPTYVYEDSTYTVLPKDPGTGVEKDLVSSPTSVQTTELRTSYWGDGSISGKVLGPDSQPVQDAKLYLVEPIKRVAVAETTTDILGEYRFDNITRDGTLFDVIADEGSGAFEKMISSKRMPMNKEPHELIGTAKRGSLFYDAKIYRPPVLNKMTATNRKGTSGVAILNQKDPYYDKTLLLVDADATTIWDKSKYARTFTKNTLTTTASNPPPIGTHSIQLSGANYGNFSGFPDHLDRDMTLEFYFRVTSAVSQWSRLITIGPLDHADTTFCVFNTNWNDGNKEQYSEYSNMGGWKFAFPSAGNVLNYNVWYHMAWVRNGDTFSVYRDGVLHNSQVYRAYPIDLRSSSNTIYIGSLSTITAQLAGIRMSSVARYTSNFTPPTSSDLYG